MTTEIRLDLRKEVITLDDGEQIPKIRWYLQATKPMRDLWMSCKLFDDEVEAVNDFAAMSYIARYDNFVNGMSLPDPTGE